MDRIPAFHPAFKEIERLIHVKGDSGPQGEVGPSGPEGARGPIGVKGLDGSKGDRGPRGDKGDQGETGEVGINWRGPFRLGDKYAPRDAVEFLGSSWIATEQTQNAPGFGVIAWDLIAQKGLDGGGGGSSEGGTGTQGPQGEPGADGDAADIAAETHAATSKVTPVDADELPIVDSAAAWVLKRLTWANLKATLKSYFDTLYPLGSGTSSGTNTGDQTNISGNAGTVTTNANLTGPITSTGNATAITSPMVVSAINGGTAANDDITIQGTAHATRTTSYVNLQPNGGNVLMSSTGLLQFGGTTSGFSAFKKGSSNSRIAIRLADDSEYGYLSVGFIEIFNGAERMLQFANNAGNGVRGFVMGSDTKAVWTNVSSESGDGGNGANADAGLSRNAAGVLEINSGAAGTFRDLKLRTLIVDGQINNKSFTVATLPSAATAGGLVYVSDAAVAPCLAFSQGSLWKRCDNAATTVV